ERVRDGTTDLIGLVALPRQDYDVVRSGDGEGAGNGVVPIRDALVRRAMHAGLDVIDDTIGIFGSRIVARHDRMIREPLGDRAHLRTLAAVAITTAPEDHDQPALREGPNGREGALERVGRVRVVAKHRRPLVDALEPTGDLRERREAARDLVVR